MLRIQVSGDRSLILREKGLRRQNVNVTQNGSCRQTSD